MNIGEPTTDQPILIPEEPLLPQTQPAPEPAAPVSPEPLPEKVPVGLTTHSVRSRA
jgi:hypothetical protein